MLAANIMGAAFRMVVRRAYGGLDYPGLLSGVTVDEPERLDRSASCATKVAVERRSERQGHFRGVLRRHEFVGLIML